MRKPKLEIADPAQWLRSLSGESGGYRRLVLESGGMARAAYRLARAHCSAESGDAPLLGDLQAAASLLAARLGGHGSLPIKSLLPSSLPPPAPSTRARSGSRPVASRVSP